MRSEKRLFFYSKTFAFKLISSCSEVNFLWFFCRLQWLLKNEWLWMQNGPTHTNFSHSQAVVLLLVHFNAADCAWNNAVSWYIPWYLRLVFFSERMFNLYDNSPSLCIQPRVVVTLSDFYKQTSLTEFLGPENYKRYSKSIGTSNRP